MTPHLLDSCLEAALERAQCNDTRSELGEVGVEETEVDKVTRLVDHMLVFLRHSDGQSVALEKADRWSMIKFEI